MENIAKMITTMKEMMKQNTFKITLIYLMEETFKK